MVANLPLDVRLLALPEAVGVSLYGIVDILCAAGTLQGVPKGLIRDPKLIRPRVVARSRSPFTCGNGVPVVPDLAIGEDGTPQVLIVPSLWLSPDDAMTDRYAEERAWIRECRAAGTVIYASCTGTVLLAAAGILDGLSTTSHWAFEDLFRYKFPEVFFDAAPNICFGVEDGSIVTTGGASSSEDLALTLISRHISSAEARRVAESFLIKWHDEKHLATDNKARRVVHADSVVRRAEQWLTEHFADTDPVAGAVAACGIAERSLKRRFRQATGVTPIVYAQNLRIEAAKAALEHGARPVEDIAADVGYENAAFFRRLFKRCTGLSPGDYRRMFAASRVRAEDALIAV